MHVFARRSAAAGLAVVLMALGLSAQTVPKITYSDTKLKNRLRVIISEDHSAPVFAIVVNDNVIVAVGDAPAISEALARKGTLEIFDADGKPLPAGPGK